MIAVKLMIINAIAGFFINHHSIIDPSGINIISAG
jgi:hypothetical protein